jgi:hypothetical protein
MSVWVNWSKPYYGVEIVVGKRSVWIGWTTREYKARGW